MCSCSWCKLCAAGTHTLARLSVQKARAASRLCCVYAMQQGCKCSAVPNPGSHKQDAQQELLHACSSTTHESWCSACFVYAAAQHTFQYTCHRALPSQPDTPPAASAANCCTCTRYNPVCCAVWQHLSAKSHFFNPLAQEAKCTSKKALCRYVHMLLHSRQLAGSCIAGSCNRASASPPEPLAAHAA